MKRLRALWFLFLLLGGLLVLANTTPAHAIAVTFTDLNLKQLPAFGTGGFGSFDFDITNSTGVTWTDFHFQGGIGFFTTYAGPGTPTFGGTPTAGTLDVVGLNILNGAHYISTVGAAEGEAFFVSGNPTTGGGPGPTPTPEPSTMLLLGSGIIGFVGFRKKFQK